jgi:ketosteroid isomerase-like protein
VGRLVAETELQLVEHLFAAFERGSIEAVIDLISDDFMLTVPPAMSAEPDTYTGPEGARRYMDAFDGVMDDVRFRAEELHAEAGCVLALVRITGRGAASGLEVDMQSAAIIRIREGQVTGIEPHPDLASARDALGGR